MSWFRVTIFYFAKSQSLISILVRSNLNGDEKDRMPDYELLSQMSWVSHPHLADFCLAELIVIVYIFGNIYIGL